MSITDPNNYPEKTGIDPRDENHLMFPKKMVKVYVKPLAHKVIEKNLWFELVFILMIFLTGVGTLIGRSFQWQWYAIMFLSLIIIGVKVFNKLDLAPIPEEPKEEEILPVTQTTDGDGSIS